MSDKQTLNAILRSDLNAFIQKVFQTVSPGNSYLHNWHIEAIAYELMQIHEGESRRLIMTQPPRSLKSICTSVAFVAWSLGHNPALRFACVSYSSELAGVLARQFRAVVTSEWYRELFPAMRIEKDTETEFQTSKRGGRVALSIGGTFTGRGADVIIVDDPMKADEAQSESARRTVNEWYSTTLVSRLNDKKKGAIILVMQRLHEDDLAGKLLIEEGWRHLDLPAIAEEDQEISISRAHVYRREAGEALHEDREPLETLMALKHQVGSMVFSAQYQQRPVPFEGNVVRREWIKFYDKAPERGVGKKIVQSWDIATTTGETNDFSVCTTWMIVKKDYYLLDLWRGKREFPKLRWELIRQAETHAAKVILIEDAGPGQHLNQELRTNPPPGVPRPIGITPKGDKLVRMDAQSVRFESGQVYFPKEAPWLGDLMNELLAFPHARHDDQVDSISQFLKWAERKRKDFSNIALFGGEVIYLEE